MSNSNYCEAMWRSQSTQLIQFVCTQDTRLRLTQSTPDPKEISACKSCQALWACWKLGTIKIWYLGFKQSILKLFLTLLFLTGMWWTLWDHCGYSLELLAMSCICSWLLILRRHHLKKPKIATLTQLRETLKLPLSLWNKRPSKIRWWMQKCMYSGISSRTTTYEDQWLIGFEVFIATNVTTVYHHVHVNIPHSKRQIKCVSPQIGGVIFVIAGEQNWQKADWEHNVHVGRVNAFGYECDKFDGFFIHFFRIWIHRTCHNQL